MSIPTLCLNMIVKNESKIIERLFDSVSSFIDCYCICDTGSTDNTVELITNYFSAKNIPGKILCEPFKNFCHNRNFALHGAIGMSDYILLMDADMILDLKQFDKSRLLSGDAFTLLQGTDSFHYHNIRIVKNDGRCAYRGVTHEYMDVPTDYKTLHILKDSLFINDIGDGGAKIDKYERDIKLLTQGLIDEPTNARYCFYLANSYYDIKNYDKAIENYLKRISMGGWEQEIFYSTYRIGLAYSHMDKKSDAIYYWLEAYNYFPTRLESLYEVIKHYRINKKHTLGIEFYNLAKKTLDQKHNMVGHLFLHQNIYDYLIIYEYTILSYYIGIKNINDECVTVLNKCSNTQIISNLFTNYKFYNVMWRKTSTISFDDTIRINVNGSDMTFHSSSCCMIPIQYNKYMMCVRYVNHTIRDNGTYDWNKNRISINRIIELDDEMNIVRQKWFDSIDTTRLYSGVEDLRIFNDRYSNVIRFIGTAYHQNNKMGVVDGTIDMESKTNKLDSNELIPVFNLNFICEKNWVYVDYAGAAHIIYKWFPLTICAIDRPTNQLIQKEERNMPAIFRNARGSSCGSIYGDEIWFVVHIVSHENPKQYYHMVCVFDQLMNLLRYSAPFKFDNEPIERCIGLVVERSRVLINYTTMDRTTQIGIYDRTYVESMLKYKTT